jgi:hypothetical protein
MIFNVLGASSLKQPQKLLSENDINADIQNNIKANGGNCTTNLVNSKSRSIDDPTSYHMNTNHQSIQSRVLNNNQQQLPSGAPSSELYNQQHNISQYSNTNSYINQNNPQNNYNMVAAGQQSEMDMRYNSPVMIFRNDLKI